MKTTKKIMNHIGQKIDFTQNILIKIDAKKRTDTEKPTSPNAIDDSKVVNPISEDHNKIKQRTGKK